MVGCHHWLSGHQFEQTPGDSEGQGSLACCSSWGRKELDPHWVTELDWTELKVMDRDAWRVAVHGVAKRQTRLSDWTDWLTEVGASSKESACQCRRYRRCRFDAWFGKILWSRKWQPSPVFLPGKSHWQRSLVGCSPQDRKELDMIEHWKGSAPPKASIRFGLYAPYFPESRAKSDPMV